MGDFILKCKNHIKQQKKSLLKLNISFACDPSSGLLNVEFYYADQSNDYSVILELNSICYNGKSKILQKKTSNVS